MPNGKFVVDVRIGVRQIGNNQLIVHYVIEDLGID